MNLRKWKNEWCNGNKQRCAARVCTRFTVVLFKNIVLLLLFEKTLSLLIFSKNWNQLAFSGKTCWQMFITHSFSLQFAIHFAFSCPSFRMQRIVYHISYHYCSLGKPYRCFWMGNCRAIVCTCWLGQTHVLFFHEFNVYTCVVVVGVADLI